MIGASCISYKQAFVNATYSVPEDGPQWELFDKTVIEPMRVHATIGPYLVTGFDDAAKAGECVAGFADDTQIGRMRAFGTCLAGTGPTGGPSCVDPATDRWDQCMAGAFGWVQCSCTPTPAGCAPTTSGDAITCTVDGSALPTACTTLGKVDQFRLLTAIGHAAEAMVSYELDTLGPLALDAPAMPADMKDYFKAAIGQSAMTLRCDGANSESDCGAKTTARPRTIKSDAATLAVSGGAANGAYPAGFLFELLSARAEAIRLDPRAKTEGFSATTGTSVGALLAPIVDLALTDQAASQAALDWCKARTAPLPAPTSALECALNLFEYVARVNEWDLLCVEDGDFLTDFVQGPSGPTDPGKPAFGRFWPLEEQLLEPFYRHFGGLLSNNDMTRVVMTADTQSKTLQGLDERTCRTATMPGKGDPYSCSSGGKDVQLACLPCGVMASVPNPLFARAPNRVWSGVRPEGEVGTFLDGGLRSGLPALRAVQLSAIKPNLTEYTPVLAFSTERAQSTPSKAPRNGLELALVSLDSLVQQGHHWELSYATLFEQQRRKHARFPLAAVLGQPVCGVAVAQPTPSLGAGIFWNFMPAKIESMELGAGGYQFDPQVTTGLFLAGRKAFLDQASDPKRNVLTFLRWQMVKAAVEKPDASGDTWLNRRRAKYQVDRDAWYAGFPKTEAAWKEHIQARHDLLDDKLQECPQ